jgi:hypothetical protein
MCLSVCRSLSVCSCVSVCLRLCVCLSVRGWLAVCLPIYIRVRPYHIAMAMWFEELVSFMHVCVSVCMHVCIPLVCKRSRKHNIIHKHTCTYIRLCRNIHTHVHALLCRIHTQTQTYTHFNAGYTHKHKRTCTFMQDTHTNTNIHALSCRNALLHKCTHIYPLFCRTHIKTHT